MAEPTPPAAAATKKKKRGIIGRLFRWTLLLGFLGAAGFAAYIYFYPVPDHEIFNFVPKDAVFVLEADDPIENWKSFSGTKVWRHLKKNSVFSDIESDADFLDTLIKDNSTIFSLISGKKLLIAAQMISEKDYDFLYIMDLKKGAKIAAVMDLFKGVLSDFGVPILPAEFDGHKGYKIGDPGEEVLLCFEGNILLASFNLQLMKAGIASPTQPSWSTDQRFVPLRDDAFRVGNRASLVKFHLNFSKLDEYMGVYMDDLSTVNSIAKSLDFAALDFKMEDDYAQMDGFISVDTSQKAMPSVLVSVAPGEVRAQNILPQTTSFLLCLDFDDFDTYYDKIGTVMGDDEGYQEYEKTQGQIGKLLGVAKSDKKIERKKRRGKDVDYFDWIGQEIALAMIPADSQGVRQSYVACIHIPDLENATHDLQAIEKKIRSRSPVKFEEYQYKGKTISYLEMKGLFRLFLGKLFNKFDKPKYSILDEFVIFSNDTTAIHQVIDVVNGEKPNLPNDAKFRDFFGNFEANSNYFFYMNTHNFFPYLPSLGSPESAAGIRKNEQYITCFPRVGMQLTARDGRYVTKLYMDFDTAPRKAWWEPSI